jgi:hypothetical protein
VLGTFWRSFIECIHKNGLDLFDGVEMSMTLVKILCKHFGNHLLSILRFPPLQKFQIWIHLHSHLLQDMELISFADHIVLDTHSFTEIKKQEVFQSFENLKSLKNSGVNMDKVVLDVNCNRDYDEAIKRKGKISLMYEYGCAGLSYKYFPHDYPYQSKKDMISQAYHHPFE